MNFYEYQITSDYGTRTDPINGEISNHTGIDYAVPLNTEITTNVSGTVTNVNTNPNLSSYGIYVDVRDANGNTHRYAHLNSATVKVMDKVNIGDVIALSGSTGRSTGPHVHYEVKDKSYKNVDPSSFVKTSTNTSNDVEIKTFDDFSTFDISGKIQLVVFYAFKFIIMALLIILFVVFITKSLDISII